jgi:hypothetical protein
VAATGNTATVTVTLKLIDLANTTTPMQTLSKKAPVTDGKAQVTFDALPAKTLIGSFDIEGGTKNGYASYRGAADLQPGTNTVDLAPRGASMTSDVVAQVIEDLVANPNAKAALLPRLAQDIRNVVEYVRQRETITFRNAFDTFVAQLMSSVSTVSLGGQFTAPGGGTFANSVRPLPLANILAAGRAVRFTARVTANPGKPNEVATVSNNLTISDDNKTLTLDPVSLQAPTGKNEVVVEILPATFTPTTAPIFKGYDVQTAPPPDQPASPAILVVTPASTAQALAYDQWKNKGDTFNQNISQFLEQKPDVSTLAARIETQLNTVLQSTSAPDQSFTWPTDVTQEAKVVASETKVVPRSHSIDGTIKDNDTDLPLAGVFVGVADTDFSDITDENGYFQIMELPPGTYSLVIKRDGYAPVTYPGVSLNANVVLQHD